MKEQLIGMLIGMLMKMFSPDILKQFMDALLDAAEDAVAKSENTLDDAIALPLISMIREAFNIPDNDPVE